MKVERMDGPRVRLTPVTPDDHVFLYNLAISDENAYRWVLRGELPPFERFVEQQKQSFTTSFVVWQRDSGERIGQALVYNVDFRNGHCYVAVVVAPQALGQGYGRETLGVLLGYAFAVWPLRKVYAEVPGFTFEGVEVGVAEAAVMGIFNVEGRLRSHLYVDGDFHDMVIIGFDRGGWKGLDAFLAAWNPEPAMPPI